MAEGLSTRTVQYLLVVLRKALQQAVEDGLIPRNAAQGVRVSQTKEEIRPLSPEQAKILLTAPAVGALLRHREAQDRERATAGSGREDNHLVFRSTTGTPLNRHNLVRRSFKPLLEKAGLPGIRFHDLRHTCATILLSKGKHPKYVQALLGHATVAITLDTYSHVLPGMDDGLCEAIEDALS